VKQSVSQSVDKRTNVKRNGEERRDQWRREGRKEGLKGHPSNHRLKITKGGLSFSVLLDLSDSIAPSLSVGIHSFIQREIENE